jgi:hypothetical protein
MHKLAIYTLTFGALSLSACTQSPPAKASAKSEDIFNGEIWLRLGKRVDYRPEETLYLREANHQEIPTNAFSLPTLHRVFGIDEVEGIIGQKKANYISD